MSPEQIEGRTVDARCDIYALGIILYEMLVGEVPFADQSTPAVLVKQLKERPIRPSLKNAAVPPALEAIALRCLEKDPEQRYQTADAFAAALNEAAVTLTAPETANDVTLPMARAAVPPVLPGASPAQTDATLLSPAKAAQQVSAASAPPVAAPLPMQAPAAPVAAVPKSAADTKPTVAQPAIAPAVAAPLPPSPQRSSSIAPLIAVAAVLLVLAGGYLAWSGRQSPDTTTATVTNPPTDAPATTPASAQPAAPPVAAADTTAATPTSAPGAPAASPSAPPVPATPPASAANQPAATAAATKESQSAKSTPPASIASATKAASTAAANASKNVAAPPLPPATAAAAGSAPAPAREAPAQPAPAAAPPTIPENAAVAFHCSGAPEVCASLRTTVNDALDKAGFRLVSNADRADIAVGAVAGVLDEKASRQFGQNFNTRTYQIELSGEAPKFGDTVSMPPTSTVSFDATVGRERLEEKSRLVASDIVDRVRAYVKKKRGA
jgi:serine/threonine-protein kinase